MPATKNYQRIGAIDIGSNAVRLLLMNVYESADGPIFVKDSIYRVALRLGEEAFLTGKLSDKKISDLTKTIKAFRNILEVNEVEIYEACATSAMREASNSKKVIEKIKEKTGIEIKVISGQREADIIFGNHIEKLVALDDGVDHYLYIDVGGGSTELILIDKGKMIDKWSFDIGTLRVKHDMVNASTWKEMRSWLNQFRHKYSNLKGIGSGGNINHILKHYKKGNDNKISLEIIETCYRMLRVIPDEDKQSKLGMREDRADVIVPALEIFRKVMNWVDMDEMYVPKLGLPEGIVKIIYDESKKKKQKK